MLPLLNWKVAHPNQNSARKPSCEMDLGQVYLLTGFHSFPRATKLRFSYWLMQRKVANYLLSQNMGNIALFAWQHWPKLEPAIDMNNGNFH